MLSKVVQGSTMGTQYRITVVVSEKDNTHDWQNVEQGVVDVMELVNTSMSNYIESSEVNEINRLKRGIEVNLSKQMDDIIEQALSISKLTKGAFDITMAPLIDLWGFGAKPINTSKDINQRNIKKVTQSQLQQIKQYVGYDKLLYQTGKLSKKDSRVEINLSAIAKGYAVDKVSEYLSEQGFERHLVSIGGELRASGLNTKNKQWTVGVEKPHILGGIVQVVKLDNNAIATSGDYRNFIEIDGIKYSHTIDPSLLQPVEHKLASVSVIDKNTSTADALATALMVMGDTKAVAFAKENNIAAYFIIRSEPEMMAKQRNNENMGNETFVIRFTDSFAPYLDH